MKTFSLFYQYSMAHKEYNSNKNIPHASCLCKVCESFCGKTLKRLFTNGKDVPTNHYALVELYSCTGDMGCMMSNCEECKNHNLVVSDFVTENF